MLLGQPQPAHAEQLLADVSDGGPLSAAKTVAAVRQRSGDGVWKPREWHTHDSVCVACSALQVSLIMFIIIQGPKGEGMINSLNGAL